MSDDGIRNDGFDELWKLDRFLEGKLGKEMLIADFEQAMIQRGREMRMLVEHSGGQWSPDTFIWTFISAVASETMLTPGAAAVWVTAIVDSGAIERTVEALNDDEI